MPSIILGNASGGQNVLSGAALYSGTRASEPVGGVQLRWSSGAPGTCYVALSGNMTVNSGGVLGVSGAYLSGLLDGMPLYPGDAIYIPKLGLGGAGPNSGMPTLFAACDAAASGVGRLYWESF